MTTPPGSLPQHHFNTLHNTMGSVKRSSCSNSGPVRTPLPFWKKLRMKFRGEPGSGTGRKGKRTNGVERPIYTPATSMSDGHSITSFHSKPHHGQQHIKATSESVPTSKLQFFRTQPEQLAHLFRLDLSPQPWIFILWFFDLCSIL